MVEHRNIVNYAVYAADRFDVAAGSGSLISTSLSFDLALTGFYPPLICGKPLHLCDGQDLQALSRTLLSGWNIAPLKMTPSHFAALQQALPEQLTGRVRTLVLGGESLSPQSIEHWMKSAPGSRVFNHYGPTEATVGCVVYEIETPPTGVVPIGRPISNAKLYILDNRRRPVGIGVTGEIYIGGAGVARGYLNRLDLPAERFVKDPFSTDESARMYRTGDLGRWRADGNVEFLGRNDHQVKIRGFRIELGEIEAQLRSHEGVQEVAVIAREDAPGDKRLVAYYSAAPSVETEKLRAHLKEKLPEYMWPAAFVKLERLPLTANGKLDRKALPAPDMSALSTQEYEAPQGEIEATLANIWKELLNVERVGRRDNFFDLGGHSLLTLRLIARVRKMLDRQLTLEDIFDHPTIYALAQLLSNATSVTTLPIERADRSGPLPLSLAQQRLWFIEQFGGAGAAYHLAGAVRLIGSLDIEALQASLDAILRRHEVLRTVLRNADGRATQVIRPEARFALSTTDLRGMVKQDLEIPRLMRQEADGAFDLGEGPLIRGRLFKLADAEYILLFTMHHIVSDGWSIGVLIRELGEFYAAHREGRADSLPALRTQYADYAQWQRQWLTGEVLQKQLDYWKRHLQGAPALLELPTDRPRPAVQSLKGASIRFSLGSELTRRVAEFSRRVGVTLHMTLFTAWAILLARLSHQRDIVIGTPVANRQRPEVEGLIGFFVNTLPLRVQVADELRVSELLRRVREATLAGYAHQEVPFEQIVEAVQPPRTMSHGALIQVMFSFQNAPHSEFALPGVRLVPERLPGSSAQFDVTLALQELGEEISGGINYATALFDDSTIERWIAHYKTLLEAVVQDAEQSVMDVPLLQRSEHERILAGFNANYREFPQDALIHELFEQQVDRTPGAVALVTSDRQLTYAQLNDAANRLAGYLRARGIGPDRLVGLCIERGAEMVVALLGILKAGGAYLPLDANWPPARLAAVLEDAAPSIVLTQARLDIEWPRDCATIVALDAQCDEIAALESAPVTANGTSHSNLAYVLFTSGSTGKPKGVMVTHAGVVSFLRSMQLHLDIQSTDCVLGLTTLSFDIAALEIYLPLISGARLVLADREASLDSRVLGEALDRFAVNVLQATPVTWRALLDSGWSGRPQLRALCGGEALATELAGRIRPLVRELWNLYGPTECTIWSTARQITRVNPDDGSTQSIGAPLANTRIYILDARRKPVPTGVQGEIFIAGAGVARGYLERPELTAERFVQDPFSADADARMYRTGDLGRWLADGSIDFLGRTDSQVKLRGFRIELGEIEAQLSAHEGVSEVAVVVREDVPGDRRLVAYYRANENDPGIDELRAHLKAKLPEYMLPAAYVRLDRLPLTSNGKLDRKSLPAPDVSVLQTQQWEPPQGETETALAAVWQALLRIDRVGRRDNFFELGGHSLLAVQMAHRLREANISATMRDVFSSRNLAELATAVQTKTVQTLQAPPNLIPQRCQAIDPAMLTLVELTQQHIDLVVSRIPGGAANVQDIYPLAPLQEGLLFHHLLNQQGGDAYVRSIVLSVDSRERLAQLIATLQEMIAAHDVLRTAVLWEGLPRPVQVVTRSASLPVQELPLDPHGNAAGQLRDLASSGKQRLDLSAAPLMRLCIVPDSDGSQWHALLQTHHLVLDNQSLQSMFAELTDRLEGRAAQVASSTPYRNYVFHALSRARAADAEKFFRAKLGDIDEPTAMFGLVDVHGDGARLDEARDSLDSALSMRLRALARRMGTSTATLFHSIWALVVGITSGRDDVVYGTVLLDAPAGSESTRMLGMAINTLPLRLRLQDLGARELVEQTHRELAELLQHDQTSLAVAQRCSGAAVSTPLFNSLLNFRRAAGSSATASSGAAGVSMVASVGRTHYPFTLSVDDLGETFALKMECVASIAPQRMLDYLRTAASSLVDALEQAPETPAVALAILPESERHQIQEQFNRTHTEYPSRLVHELFEEQVRRTPAAVALMYEGRSLTYSQLNAKANQLARRLIARGIGPDQLVGICADRGFEMVIGLLGILKAGGAYVPLDPGYPTERLAHVLEDAAPRLLLIQEHLRGRVPAAGSEVIALDSNWASIARESTADLDARSLGLHSRHLSYVIYTSGSTGRPKGAMNEHRGVANRLQWMQEAYQLDSSDCVLQKTPFSFDVSVWEFFWTLMTGARLVIARPEGHKDPAYLRELIEETGVTRLHFVPAMLPHFLDSLRPGECRGIHHVVCSGEELPASLQEAFFRHLPKARLSNLYGPTEAAVDVTAWECQPDDRSSRVPIGRPIANIRIHVLDRHGRIAPMGVAGELYIAGVGVGRGYLNRAELTNERFVSDPFSADPQARMYRTGDLARWRGDGVVEYLGRNDHQVKIRGFRVELGEIESQLARHSAVKEVAVVARGEGAGEKRLVAYIVPRDQDGVQGTVDVEALRAHLKVSLPEYMIPGAFVTLQQFPLSPNGKLQRNALPAPDREAYAVSDYEAPRGEVEEILAGIWQELLGVERVGRSDNFFELGGHSLLTVRMIERLRRFGLLTEVLRVFENPKLDELAAALTREPADQAAAPANLIPAGCTEIRPEMLPLVQLSEEHLLRVVRAVPGGAGNVQDVYPLAPLQEGILFHHLMSEQGDAYILSMLLEVRSRAELDALLGGLQSVIDRHDILRSAVLWDGLPQPVQVVYRHAPLHVEEVIPEQPAGGLDELRARMAPQRLWMDVRRAPLVRVQIARAADGVRWYALLLQHHLINDHVGQEILFKELMAHLAGRPEGLPASAAYRDFVWRASAHEYKAAAEAFFRSKLGDIEGPTTPFGLLNVHGDGAAIEEARVFLEDDLERLVRGRARVLGVSAATLFHAAWAMVVARTSGRDDVVFGSVLLGRMRGSADVDRSMGMFINTLPLRVRLKEQSAEQLVQQVQREIVELLRHEQAPLAVAQRCSGVGGEAPLFSAVLNYRHSVNRSASKESGSQEDATTFGIRRLAFEERSNYPFGISVTDFGDRFELVSHTDRRVDPERVVGYLHAAVASLVQALERTPQSSALALNILPDSERQRIVGEFSASAAPSARESIIHEMFEAQVLKTPESIALVYEGERVTYRELNRKANQLAHFLRRHGVGPDERVGLCVERGPEMIIGLLGVLKAGGAYVPLGLDYPKERLEYMLADATPRVLLTQTSLGARVPQFAGLRIALDTDWPEIGKEDDSNPDAAVTGVTAKHLANVIYTSGSTGEPKGVLVEHAGLCNLARTQIDALGVRPGSRMLQFFSFNFDAFTLEWVVALCSGASFYLPTAEARAPGEPLLNTLRTHEITHVVLAPIALAAIPSTQGLDALRTIMAGGEALSQALARQWAPGRLFFNGYGPTEATVCVTSYACNPEDAEAPPIGRPIPGMRIYILDESLQPVPIGVRGEIHIGGVGVARGYLNRPELTAERFVRDPFATDGQARLYKTGDLGRWRADGVIEYLGRADNQVKIRGHRIELEEIETQLARHEHVREAVVTVRADHPGEKRLVAYMTLNHDVSARELRDFLRQRLPDFMLPSMFVTLDALPLTPNGKVDRKALVPPEGAGQVAAEAYVAPRTAAESVIAGIWTSLLRVNVVGVHDNFFAIGGHSLLLVQFAARVRDVFQVSLTLKQFFDHPTVAGVVDELARACGDRAVVDETAAVYISVASLSDDEVRQALTQIHE
ncbi:MAG TPA: amino acid adenylation domain-containing protein [Steroidobacteraceae bacterium]|nr:amino acid adenylation domain-containing protein [Steroidobacteraceae bacterium]